MTDLEFDVLDELYFVISFDDLKGATELDTETLRKVLFGLLEKHWVKCFGDHEEEIEPETLNFEQNYRQYAYLASKEGLMVHNGQA
jgi:hypothetical protein